MNNPVKCHTDIQKSNQDKRFRSISQKQWLEDLVIFSEERGREGEERRRAQMVENTEEGNNLVGKFDEDGDNVAKVGINFQRGQCYVGRK